MSTLSSKLIWMFKEECAAQRRLSERNSDIALYETNRELESQRLELYQANPWADHAQREKR